MSSLPARIIWDPRFQDYCFDPLHPMSPVRLDLTAKLAQALGLLADPTKVQVTGADPATEELLHLTHSPDFVAAVREASQDPSAADPAFGLGTEDVPAFSGMHTAAARIVQGTVDAVAAVWSETASHGVNFSGGFHHAFADQAAGFCVYNDLAVAIDWLLDHGATRVAYVDVDVHHGDGVEKIFWDDPRVLTISVHESGETLFPGTGFEQQIGGSQALGSAVNITLPAGTSDAAWLATAPRIETELRRFQPEFILSQHGCDSHALDPLAHLRISIAAQRQMQEFVHRMSHELCAGRWVATGGGGYEVVQVVPLVWSHLIAVASHQSLPLETPIPAKWAQYVRRSLGQIPPSSMGAPDESLPVSR